ncbi:MAG: hypothetical protein MUF00_11265 [Gemmatimonadaceae bacterium]|jgi:hypothetical protein|nr:hypothetical protein [Gemmatimonadaceae bacterium]
MLVFRQLGEDAVSLRGWQTIIQQRSYEFRVKGPVSHRALQERRIVVFEAQGERRTQSIVFP